MFIGRQRRFPPIALALFCVAAAAMGVPAWGQTVNKAGSGTDARLREVQRELESGRAKSLDLKRKATELESEVVSLRRDLIEAAAIIQSHERKAAELAERLDTLEDLQSTKVANLAQRRRQFGATLMALQKVARHPPEAMVAQLFDHIEVP